MKIVRKPISYRKYDEFRHVVRVVVLNNLPDSFSIPLLGLDEQDGLLLVLKFVLPPVDAPYPIHDIDASARLGLYEFPCQNFGLLGRTCR